MKTIEQQELNALIDQIHQLELSIASEVHNIALTEYDLALKKAEIELKSPKIDGKNAEIRKNQAILALDSDKGYQKLRQELEAAKHRKSLFLADYEGKKRVFRVKMAFLEQKTSDLSA